MTLTAAATIEEVAAAVSEALHANGIDAVLVGGACAALHSGGAFHSDDLDFILRSVVTAKRLDEVMALVGFERRGNLYTHGATPFFVEFPAGPLGIGADLRIKPISYRIGSTEISMLSATDSCRDRLAAFFHWGDRQGLTTAVAIAVRESVDLTQIRKWSEAERHVAAFDEFMAELTSRQGEGSRREPKRRRRPAPRRNGGGSAAG